MRDLRTIVVVEADRALREEATEMFGSAGLHVIAFDDGARALAYLEGHKDDVEAVFMDMEGWGAANGVDLANLVGRVCPTIAVIATGATDTERPEALDPQIRYFAKPWMALDVVNAMQDVVMGQ